MRSHVLLYGLLGGVLIAGLKFIEYRWLVVAHSVQIYGALVAALFAALGVWLGRRLLRPTTTTTVVVQQVAAAPPPAAGFTVDAEQLATTGITPRELQILQLIADGLSNKEIAARLHVSENTVKTHSSRLFDKLGARRRTQAVQLGKQLRLIP